MPIVKELQINLLSERANMSDINAYIARGESFPTPIRDKLKTLVETDKVGKVDMEFHSVVGYVSEESDEFVMCSVLALHVEDFEAAETRITKLAKEANLETELEYHRAGTHNLREENEPYKSIEIYYNCADIPAGYEHDLDFRNEAMELIEQALEAADAGEWVGAESGANLETGESEVNFGFEVTDFERAEKIVRAAVKGTPYECIREITRYEESGAV